MSDSQSPGNSGQSENDKARASQQTGSMSISEQLQADLQAHETANKLSAQERRLAARNTGELMRPSSGKYTNELEKIVQSTVKQQTQTDMRKPTAEYSPQAIRAKRFAAFKTFGLFMVGMVLLLACIMASRQAATQMQAKQSFMVARTFLTDKKYDLAAEHFTQSLKKAPENSEAYFQRGMAYAHSGHFEQALQDYDKVLTMTPDRTAALNGKSLANLKQKNYDRSIAVATVALAHDPLDRNALLLRSVSYSRQGKLNEALADCNKLIESKPKGGLGPAYGNRAFIYFKLGQPHAAIRDYRYAIKYAPKNALLYANLAQCLKRVDDIEGAIEECKNALKLDPKDLPSLMLAGECYRQTGEPGEAVKYYERAVKVASCPETLKARGEAAMEAGDYKLAYNSFNQILESNPKDEDAKRKRQICHSAVIKSQGVSAAKKLEEESSAATVASAPATIKLAKTFPELLHQGYSLLQAGSASTAAQALNLAVRMEPRHALARRYLAYALTQSGDYANACQQFAVLGRIQRLNAQDLMAYTKATIGARQYADTLKVCRVLLGADPTNFVGRSSLAQAYLEMGQYPQATAAANDGMRYARSESEKEAYRVILATAQRGTARQQ